MKKLVVRTLLIGVLLLLGALFGVQQINETLGISQPEPLLTETKESIESNQGEGEIKKKKSTFLIFKLN
ncbi:hypothetical protein [Halalkalibacter krulwichiae]|uniref:Uncharacterized protein n=1 Tax=Halalkalibacter krulwichiae TaxID=199441 RepID=A0A1X9M7B4_9BACI|nr:hypothetical protein [Halalkalibacter krulwichiae]ARK29306.1 hypothetical protein BkAM31D_05240 [Halalkalibacter krulwichiae]